MKRLHFYNGVDCYSLKDVY